MQTLVWLSNDHMNFGVEIDDNNTINYTPPIARKFIGQKLDNLVWWLNKMAKTTVEYLDDI